MAKCFVSYLDLSGIRHQVEVDAGSLYEAAALAVTAFKEHDCEPGQLSQLDIEIRTSVTHTLTVKKLLEWLNSGAKTPKEVVIKDRLRAIMQ
ncbi:MAG TPA: hypothetical protein VJ749_04885 [Pyrinomonadaceae bacterium]|jgi:hypothetical protein|nr:hypothetical protein [Pyrinomonadaceae bacterium]